MRNNRLAAVALALLAWGGPARAASTIDPNTPAANAPLNSAPIRGNFRAAFNDVNNILGMFAGTTAPGSPFPFQLWADTSTSPYTVKMWSGSVWAPWGRLNPSTGVFTPYLTSAAISAAAPLTVGLSGGIANIGFTAGLAGQFVQSSGTTMAQWAGISSVLTAGTGISLSGTTNVTAGLSPIASSSLLANVTGGSAAPTAVSIPALPVLATGTSVTGTLGDRFQRIYDAKDLGVVCDNSTDTATTLNAAIQTVAATGGILQLPRGKCKIASTVLQAQGVAVRGQGGALALNSVFSGVPAPTYPTCLVWSGGASGIMIDSPAYIQDAALQDLCIDGVVAAGSVGTSALKGLRLRSGFANRFERLYIQNIGIGVSIEPNFAGATLPLKLTEWNSFTDLRMLLVGDGIDFGTNTTIPDVMGGAGGVTNNFFYRTVIYGYANYGIKYAAMADDNYFDGGHIAGGSGSVGVIFNTLSPTTCTGTYSNEMSNFDIEVNDFVGNAYPMIVNNTCGFPTNFKGVIASQGTFFNGVQIANGGAITIIDNAAANGPRQQLNVNAPAGWTLINTNAGSGATSTVTLGNNVDSGLAQITANSSANTSLAGINSLNFSNSASAPIAYWMGSTRAGQFDTTGITAPLGLTLSGTITPTALSGDVNNYNPAGLGQALAVRIDGGVADRNLTGLSAGVDGRLVEIINIGTTNALVLKDQSGSSTAANRFLFGADATIGTNKAIVLRYDGTTARWRAFDRALVNTGVTAGTYGSATQSPQFTVDIQGRLSAAANVTVTPAWASLTGTPTTLAGYGVTSPLPLAQGGTAQTTAAAARASSGLNVENFTGHGDSIYTIVAADRVVGTNAAFTASRTWTLPAANAVNPGAELKVADFQGTVTPTNTLVISRAGSDTVNGGTSVTINSANGAYILVSDGISKWTAQAIGASAATGVSSLGGLTGSVGVANGIEVSGSNIQVSAARRTLPTVQTFLSGSGTYTTPANVIWIEVYCKGAGGGSSGSANGSADGVAGGAGGNTTFGSSLITCSGGAAGAPAGGAGTGGAGGTATLGAASGESVTGQSGTGISQTSTVGLAGPMGAGQGGGAGGPIGTAGVAAATNSGGGGGGPGSPAAGAGFTGSSGGEGGYAHAIINTPSATYSYAVGAAGTAGAAGTGGFVGRAGGSGRLVIIEHYGS